MKVKISHGGKDGFVSYNKYTNEVMVTHPDEIVRNTIRDYLKNPRTFVVPTGNSPDEVGGRAMVEMVPNSSHRGMILALSELKSNTGVDINWEDENNYLDNNIDPNYKADKPIEKSLYIDLGREK